MNIFKGKVYLKIIQSRFTNHDKHDWSSIKNVFALPRFIMVVNGKGKGEREVVCGHHGDPYSEFVLCI